MKHDVVIVGARVAGSSLAIRLARAGVDVVVVDRVAFPAETISTHVLYPRALQALDELDVLAAIEATGPPRLATRWRYRELEFTASHTPVAGRADARCVRRTTLDPLLVDAARRAGATVHERFSVSGLLGDGTAGAPVRGVIGTHDGVATAIEADLVVGADGVHSTVALALDLPRVGVTPSPTFMAYAYWTGLPRRTSQDFFFDPPYLATHFPTDGEHHVVMLLGPASELGPVRREPTAYRDLAAATDRELAARLAGGRQVSKLIATRRLDGFYRSAAGPGWALIGDAGHFKHPAAVQGIADALDSARRLAELVVAGESLAELERWRERETGELYGFAQWAGAIPDEGAVAELIAAASADPSFARELVDLWSRSRRPSDLAERVPGLSEALRAVPPGLGSTAHAGGARDARVAPELDVSCRASLQAARSERA